MQPPATHTASSGSSPGSRRTRSGALLFAGDVAGLALSSWLALHLKFWGAPPEEHQLPYLLFAPALLAWRLYAAHSCGLYDFRRRLTRTDHLFGALGAAALGVVPGYVLLVFVQLYYAPHFQLSRTVAGLDALFVAIWLGASRAALLSWLHATGYRVRLMLAGNPEACRELEDEIRARAPRLIELVGAYPSVSASDMPVKADQIILVDPDGDQKRLCALLAKWDEAGAELFLLPDLGLSSLVHVRVTSIAGLPLVSLSPGFAARPYRIVKTAIDAIVAAMGLLAGLPVLLAAAVAIKLSSSGPVFYSQPRVGLRGRIFHIHKLRTMIVNAEAASGPVLASDADPRVTPVGRFLRRSRLDEWPQLWNVLRGDMSLVGPRPERREFADRFTAETPLFARRLLVKPGLTGLAQIHGGYESDYRHKLRYDLVYINNMSLAADLRILIATFQTVLTGKGAV